MEDFKKNFQKKDFEKKEELIEAALIEFSQKSYDDASLNNILTAAGLSKGSFYYHFKNKKELYIYLILEVTEAKLDFMNKEIENNSQEFEFETENVFKLLKYYGRMGLKFAQSNPNYYKFALKYLKEKNEDIKNEVRKRINPISNSFVEDLIVNAIKRGEIRDDFSAEFTVRLFSHLFNNYDQLVFNDIDELGLGDDFLKKFDYFMDFIENGLGKK